MKVVLCIFITILGANANKENETETHVPDFGPEYLDQLRAEGRYEEFARITGLISAEFAKERDTEGRAELSRHEAMYNKELEFGDIMPIMQKEEEARNAIRMEKYGGSKWPKVTQSGCHEVPYTICTSDFNNDEIKYIEDSITHLNNRLGGCIKIVKRTNEKDYVYIISGNGCWSYLGRTGGVQELSLQSNGCLYRGTICHEFQHAIGFAHEQNREERNDFIEMLWENIPDDWKDQYEKTNPKDFKLCRTYDYYSIMHYPVNAPGTNKPAFKVKRNGIDEKKIGNGNSPTDMDVEKMKYLYCLNKCKD